MKQMLMSKGARIIVEKCAKVRPGEQVVIVTEPSKLTIAEAIAAAVCACGAEPLVTVITPRMSDGEEPPKTAAAAMKASDVFFTAVDKSVTHTQATRDAAAGGSRGIMMTQFSEEMLMGGGIEADFESIAPQCRAVAAAMENASQICVTTPHGTDLKMSATGRRGNALTCTVIPGSFSTIPTIEANVSPVEKSACGVIVANASIPYIGIGLLTEPVIARVEAGLITAIEGGAQAALLAKDLRSKNDPNVYNVAELGIGLNPKCHFIGAMLEDEGVYGSVHIGIGTNITLGGHTKAACHYDLIMTNATVTVDGKVILQDGQIVL